MCVQALLQHAASAVAAQAAFAAQHNACSVPSARAQHSTPAPILCSLQVDSWGPKIWMADAAVSALNVLLHYLQQPVAREQRGALAPNALRQLLGAAAFCTGDRALFLSLLRFGNWPALAGQGWTYVVAVPGSRFMCTKFPVGRV